MRINSLTLRNFKAIGPTEQRINFRPITLLYGPNSAGKSTIVQALHYLSEILSRNNCDPGTTQIGGKLDLGGFRNLVHLHDPDTPIELGIGIELGSSMLPSYGVDDEEERAELAVALGAWELYDLDKVESVEVRIKVRWSRQLNLAFVSDYSVAVNGELFAAISSTADQRQIILSELNNKHSMFDMPLTEDDDSTKVSDALQGLLEQYVPDTGANAALNGVAPLQLRFAHGAMPEFGRALPLVSSVSESIASLSEEMSSSARLKATDEDWETKKDLVAAYAEVERDFRLLTNYLSRALVGSGELSRNALQEFIYLGPLRDIPGRHYSPELSPGLARWSSGLGAWDQLYNEGEGLADKVNAWLANHKQLDAGYEVHYSEYKPLPLDSALMVALTSRGESLEDGDWIKAQLDAIDTRRKVTLRDQRMDIDLHPEDLGTGISQVLPVLVAALGHNKNIVAIEQPELHVHPKFQVALGELFIHAAKDEQIARDTVFILETHSEYMMLRFLRRLYETANDELEPDAHELVPDDIAVYYVNPKGDTAEIVQLRLTKEGEFLDRWPNGFFPERKQELF